MSREVALQVPRDANWCRVVHGEDSIGAGLILTSRLVLVPAHCLREGEAPTRLSADQGVVHLKSLVLEVNEAADLALLLVEDDSAIGLQHAKHAECAVGDPWTCSFTPAPSDAYLSGDVQVVDRPFEVQEGASVNVLQLGVNQALRNYAGYSGGPAQPSTAQQGQGPVLGMILEQVPERLMGTRAAANAIIAVPLPSALKTLTSIGSLVDQFGPPGSQHRDWPQGGGADGELHVMVDYLREVRTLCELGVLGASLARAMVMRYADLSS